MKLHEFKILKTQICTQEKYVNLCKLYNIEIVEYKNLKLNDFNKNAKYLFFKMGDEPFVYNIFKNLKCTKIFSINNNIQNEKVLSVPLSMPNTTGYEIVGNLDVIVNQFTKQKNYGKNNENLLYLNFNNSSNEKERRIVKDLFQNKDWVTKGYFLRTHDGHKKFVNEIYNHKFILCPWGAGIDTHRLWMSLYLGSIPITRYHKTYANFKHLPIVFINDWNEITEEFLNNKFEEISNKEYDFSILYIDYWNNLFKNLDLNKN